jgi:hypothetical protein
MDRAVETLTLDLVDASGNMTKNYFTGERYMLVKKGKDPFEPKTGELPNSLYVLRSQLIEFNLGDTYNQSVTEFDNKYTTNSVIRDLNPTPQDPYYGKSIISATALAIDIDDQMKDWNRRFFANNRGLGGTSARMSR